MRIFFLSLFLAVTSSFAQQPKPFTETVIFIATNCKGTVVDISSGELKVADGDLFTTYCKKGKNFKMGCTFLDSKNKQYASIETEAGMIGSEGAIGNTSNTFILNGITKKFYSEANIVLSDTRIRGKKICSGDWLYESEMKEILNQKTNKQ